MAVAGANSVVARAVDGLAKLCLGAGIDDSHGAGHAAAVLRHAESAVAAAVPPLTGGLKLTQVTWLFEMKCTTMVARWQNLIPSFPWIAPGWRAWGAIQGKEGIKFCSVA